MTGHLIEKQERIIEAVRKGLEGDNAVNFVRESGYSMTTEGIVRHLRRMGGRGFVMDLVKEGKTNQEIMAICMPDTDHPSPKVPAEERAEGLGRSDSASTPLYETTKLSLRLPSDLYEAIRLGARIERKSQNQFIVDVITKALSSPQNIPDDPD